VNYGWTLGECDVRCLLTIEIAWSSDAIKRIGVRRSVISGRG
jgi:hypothetical protein